MQPRGPEGCGWCCQNRAAPARRSSAELAAHFGDGVGAGLARAWCISRPSSAGICCSSRSRRAWARAAARWRAALQPMAVLRHRTRPRPGPRRFRWPPAPGPPRRGGRPDCASADGRGVARCRVPARGQPARAAGHCRAGPGPGGRVRVRWTGPAPGMLAVGAVELWRQRDTRVGQACSRPFMKCASLYRGDGIAHQFLQRDRRIGNAVDKRGVGAVFRRRRTR